MNQLFVVSPSPHVQSKDSVQKIMFRVILALLPAVAWSFFVFGLPAIMVMAISVSACVIFEFLIQKYFLKKEHSIADGSAILTGILLGLNVPAALPWWIVIIGALVAIGIGKMSFGGLGQNIFNPALVGRVFLLISFPVQMTLWPVNSRSGLTDAITAATPLGLIKEGVKSGTPISQLSDQIPQHLDLFYGNIGGSLGEISALFLLIGLAYMLIKKVISWHIPVSILLTMFVFSGILHLVNPELYIDPLFHILTGGAMLGAIFMATDMVTSPMTVKGQVIFGVGIGIITIAIRLFGAYPEGFSFAILIMNAVVPLINNYTKPKRFGEAK